MHVLEQRCGRVKINATAPDRCAIPFNNFRGWRPATKGAQIALSLIDETGPNGGFFRKEGEAPW